MLAVPSVSWDIHMLSLNGRVAIVMLVAIVILVMLEKKCHFGPPSPANRQLIMNWPTVDGSEMRRSLPEQWKKNPGCLGHIGDYTTHVMWWL